MLHDWQTDRQKNIAVVVEHTFNVIEKKKKTAKFETSNKLTKFKLYTLKGHEASNTLYDKSIFSIIRSTTNK